LSVRASTPAERRNHQVLALKVSFFWLGDVMIKFSLFSSCCFTFLLAVILWEVTHFCGYLLSVCIVFQVGFSQFSPPHLIVCVIASVWLDCHGCYSSFFHHSLVLKVSIFRFFFVVKFLSQILSEVTQLCLHLTACHFVSEFLSLFFCLFGTCLKCCALSFHSAFQLPQHPFIILPTFLRWESSDNFLLLYYLFCCL